MSRFSLRTRLTVVFAAAMAVVLAALGAFLYVRLDSALAESLDHTLEAQLAEVRADPERTDVPGDVVVQTLDRSGVVRGSGQPLLGGGEVERVLAGDQLELSKHVEGLAGEWRVIAEPAPGGKAAIAVASSLHENHETLDHLFGELLVAGPIGLVLASLAGYLLAAAALRPVEAMRRRAAEISAETPGRRLPVPAREDEIARLGATLNEMLTRIESSVERERRFVADASHELRTPLALLRTELDLALRRPRSRQELESALRSAAFETERLQRIAEDLLLLARSQEGGGLPLERRPVQVADVLAAVRGRFAPRAAESGRKLAVEEADGLVVDADPLRLEQALDNLVENALRHGGGAIRLAARPAGDAIELHVLDEGEGFPPEFLEHAFERFTRSDAARAGGGTGLGLAIVEVIAEAHGGSAGAANRERGADVWLRVPTAP